MILPLARPGRQVVPRRPRSAAGADIARLSLLHRADARRSQASGALARLRGPDPGDDDRIHLQREEPCTRSRRPRHWPSPPGMRLGCGPPGAGRRAPPQRPARSRPGRGRGLRHPSRGRWRPTGVRLPQPALRHPGNAPGHDAAAAGRGGQPHHGPLAGEGRAGATGVAARRPEAGRAGAAAASGRRLGKPASFSCWAGS